MRQFYGSDTPFKEVYSTGATDRTYVMVHALFLDALLREGVAGSEEDSYSRK